MKVWKQQHTAGLTAAVCTLLPYRGITGATISLEVKEVDWRDASLNPQTVCEHANGEADVTPPLSTATAVPLSKARVEASLLRWLQ